MSLDERTSTVQRELFLRTVGVVDPPAAVTSAMASAARDAVFRAGQVIYKAGTIADTIYFIARGQVRLEAPGEEPWTFDDPSVVGILDAIVGRPRLRTAVAVTDVSALALPAEDYFEILEDNFEFGREVIRGLSDGLIKDSLKVEAFDEVVGEGRPIGVVTDTELSLVERIVCLRSVELFATASVQSLASLAEMIREERKRAGETIAEEGETGGRFWVLVDGHAEVSRKDPARSARVGPAEILPHYTSIALDQQLTARALDDVVLFSIGIEELYDLMEEHAELMHSVYRYLALAREKVMAALAAQGRRSG